MNIHEAVFTSPQSVVDTHCHYNLEPIYENWRAHWEMAQARGVRASWIPGTTIETSRLGWEIAQQDPNLWSLVGVHPGEAHELTLSATEVSDSLRELIAQDRQLSEPRILGVGEIGLDYYHLQESPYNSIDFVRFKQKELASVLINLAKEFQLIISLHVRDKESPYNSAKDNAYWDMVELVSDAQLSAPFILHCSSGPLSYIRAMLELGAYVSFAGNITYPNAQAIRDIWTATPPDRRLIETDVPFLPPQGWRGKVCEPWMVVETAKWVASNL